MSIELNELNQYINEHLNKMEARPQMYAANMGSFEDQYRLLLQIQDEIGYSEFPRDNTEYAKFLIKHGFLSTIPLHTQRASMDWETLVVYLKKFRHGDY